MWKIPSEQFLFHLATNSQGAFCLLVFQEISLIQEARWLVLKLLSGYHRGSANSEKTMGRILHPCSVGLRHAA